MYENPKLWTQGTHTSGEISTSTRTSDGREPEKDRCLLLGSPQERSGSDIRPVGIRLKISVSGSPASMHCKPNYLADLFWAEELEMLPARSGTLSWSNRVILVLRTKSSRRVGPLAPAFKELRSATGVPESVVVKTSVSSTVNWSRKPSSPRSLS